MYLNSRGLYTSKYLLNPLIYKYTFLYCFMKQQYNVTLDKEVVEEAEKKIETFGGKLSTLINSLLIKFNKK